MIHRDALTTYLEEALSLSRFADYAPNGLQVEGKPEVQRLAVAVTASQAVLNEAIAWGADALLVHHGWFWKGESPILRGPRKRRIATCLSGDLNLFAYHLPLDVHRTWGNNAGFGDLIGVEDIQMHDWKGVPDLLWQATLREAVTLEAFAARLHQDLDHVPQVITASTGSPTVRSLAWCTGAAQDALEDAAALGVDAFLSGEISERTVHLAQELGVHYLACGHHASERFGVERLGAHLAQQFDLDLRFFDQVVPV
jgi:dinuclear metal center YbgI/SA1388 family protein